MPRLLLAVMVLPAFGRAPSALAQRPGQADTKTEQAITKLEHTWINAYQQRDSAALARIEAPEYMVVNPDGSVSTKAEDIGAVTSGKVKFDSVDIAEIKVRRYGSTAIATAQIRLRGQADTNDISGAYRSTDVFIQRNGQW
jgi:ketosteroid isomerase-like protein